MHLTVDEYLDTPTLTVDWDLEFAAVERRVREAKERQANGG